MKAKCKKIKYFLIKRITGDDYGFVDLNKMPKGNYIANTLDSSGINWVKTKDLKHGKNHCGATVGTNIILYLSHRSHLNFAKEGEEYNVFFEAHSIIGDGPVVFLGSKIEKYFNKKGYILKYKKVKSFQEIKKSIKESHPCAILLFTSFKNWHWVLATGWREYESGEKYFQIIDSWDDASRFYKIDEGSLLISATEYSSINNKDKNTY